MLNFGLLGRGGDSSPYGENLINDTPPILVNSDEVVENFTSNSNNDFAFDVVAVGTSSTYPRVDTNLRNSTTLGQRFRVEFFCEAIDNTNAVIATLRLGGSQTSIAHTITLGLNVFEYEPTGAGTACKFYMNGTKGTYSLVTRDWKCREIL